MIINYMIYETILKWIFILQKYEVYSKHVLKYNIYYFLSLKYSYKNLLISNLCQPLYAMIKIVIIIVIKLNTGVDPKQVSGHGLRVLTRVDTSCWQKCFFFKK